MDEENIKGVVSMNESYELKIFSNDAEVWNREIFNNVLHLSLIPEFAGHPKFHFYKTKSRHQIRGLIIKPSRI